MDPDPAIFNIDLQSRRQQKTNLKKVFYLLLFEGTFTSFFKDKKSKRSHKTAGIKAFLLFMLDYRGIRIRKAQKHVDLDPEHWSKGRI
jgi:hypothetical protein